MDDISVNLVISAVPLVVVATEAEAEVNAEPKENLRIK
jgi:hypothetical protein